MKDIPRSEPGRGIVCCVPSEMNCLPNSRAAQVLTETMTDMEKLERLFTEGVVAAGKATQNPETADRTFWKGVYAEGVTRMNEGKMHVSSEVKYSFGVTQADIDQYVEDAYAKQNTEDYKPYADVDERLVADVASEIDITGYSHALRDNDIRHIRNSHGEQTNEKYPVTKEDIARIPDIVANYDKVFVKTNANKEPGFVYVKVGENNVTYYVEAVTTQYHNEKLLVNKQMIKTGTDEIPNLVGLIAAITKKESSSQYLTDLQKIREAYVQDVKENYSINMIPQESDSVNSQSSISEENSSDKRYSIDDSADVSENAADTNVGGTEETPFEKALRRSGLAHLIDGEAEALSSSYLHPAKKDCFCSPFCWWRYPREARRGV